MTLRQDFGVTLRQAQGGDAAVELVETQSNAQGGDAAVELVETQSNAHCELSTRHSLQKGFRRSSRLNVCFDCYTSLFRSLASPNSGGL